MSSVPAANAIYRDVYTSVFNRSYLLPFTFVVHSAQQDAFYFVKEETWKANEDKGQMKRLQGQVNTTFHEIAKENGSGNNYFDVKIHGVNAVINLRYVLDLCYFETVITKTQLTKLLFKIEKLCQCIILQK